MSGSVTAPAPDGGICFFFRTKKSPFLHEKLNGFPAFFGLLAALIFLSRLTGCVLGSDSVNEPAKSSKVTGQVATCAAPAAASPSPAMLAGNMSQADPTFELVCQGGEAVPIDLAKVCRQSTTSRPQNKGTPLSECRTHSGATQYRLADILLSGAKAAWKSVPAPVGEPRKFQLAIPKDEFPVVDEKFFVGCMQPEKPESSCQVNITVSARTSEVSADNVVTCAYGKDSNKSPVDVNLTTKKNSFTLECRSDVVPADYKQLYCSGSSVDECSPKKLTSLLPRAEPSWWKTVDSLHTVKLTEDKFPSADTVFLMGCQKPAKGGVTACSVKVTIKAPTTSGVERDSYSLRVVYGVILVAGSLLASI
ncbi:srs domain-containing protein [Cystoisospora suis]|uniref:Srs domain-containing protein n=1 Tax=Cystoisospora suis TaxID=483139 RepID=A0A2C6KV55_9APIC|nr:srs domain-containing protein [Cystoisospora suis]